MLLYRREGNKSSWKKNTLHSDRSRFIVPEGDLLFSGSSTQKHSDRSSENIQKRVHLHELPTVSTRQFVQGESKPLKEKLHVLTVSLSVCS